MTSINTTFLFTSFLEPQENTLSYTDPPAKPNLRAKFLMFCVCEFMGSCFSSASDDSARTQAARVITVDGSLKEYSAPVTVSSVLKAGQSRFLCDSDSLYFDTDVSALDSKAVLEPGHVYFVLPVAKLGYPLSGSDMAALAVKASSALARGSEKRGKCRKIRISPVEEPSEGDEVVEQFDEFSVTKNEKKGNKLVSRPRPRPRNRVRLSLIQEGDEYMDFVQREYSCKQLLARFY